MPRIRSGSASSGMQRASISCGSVNQRPPWMSKARATYPSSARASARRRWTSSIPGPSGPSRTAGLRSTPVGSARCPIIVRPSAGYSTVRVVTVVMRPDGSDRRARPGPCSPPAEQRTVRPCPRRPTARRRPTMSPYTRAEWRNSVTSSVHGPPTALPPRVSGHGGDVRGVRPVHVGKPGSARSPPVQEAVAAPAGRGLAAVGTDARHREVAGAERGCTSTGPLA